MIKCFKNYPLTCFLIVHFLVWSILPLLRDSLPMDSIEAVVWGWYCDWGTNKHPPLSGFVTYWFYVFGGKTHYAIYALSQICVLLGFVYVYKLATFFLDKQKAVAAVMLLEGVIYYGYSAAECNVNVMSLALWPITVFYFYKALQTQKLSDWFLLGFFAGLNILNKYVCGVLLIAMLFYMFYDKKARSQFKTFGPYLAAIMCVAVVAPHVWWLYQHDFFVFDYFLGRSTDADLAKLPILAHIFYPLKFLFTQALFGAGAFLIYFTAVRGSKNDKICLSDHDRAFLLVLGLMPLALMVLVSFVGGIKLKSMWGFPCLYMLGIILLTFIPRKFSETVMRKIYTGVYIVMLIMALALCCVFVFNKSDKMHLNAPQFALQMENIWFQNSGGKTFNYVVGDVWWADNVALYAPSQPKPIIWGDVNKNPWFDGDDFANSGALIVAADKKEYKWLTKHLTNVTQPQVFIVEIKNPIGKIKRKLLYYGFYNL